MKIYKDILESQCKEYTNLDFAGCCERLSHTDLLEIIESAVKIYTLQVGKDIRQRCLDNVEVIEEFEDGDPIWHINEDSILNIEIKLP